jgi:MOSC domain-containing protein YiiM
MLHRKLNELEDGLEEIRLSPKDQGRLELIVRRPVKGQREVLTEGELSFSEGLVGDCWKTYDPHPNMQINIMNARAIAVIAGDRLHWPLAGDQLYVDLDLSEANMPPGTKLEVGSAVLEITMEPHTGCSKFASRFGVDAVKFVNSPGGRALNLRGRNARVAKAGTIRSGDIVRRAWTSG